MQGYNQTAEFFLSNYRLGKTLGVGSFGKVRWGCVTLFSFDSDREPAGATRAVPVLFHLHQDV